MNWHDLLPLAVFLVTFAASVLSGMAGGGGSFIITPFYILIGLTPQQAVATGKFASFGLTGGAIAAFRKRMLEDKKFSLFVIVIAAACGLAASLLLKKINNGDLQRLMGALMLAMVPLMLRKGRTSQLRHPSNLTKLIGTVFLTVVMLLQGILSGGIGSLVSAILIIFFGTTALEANIMKRKSSLVLNTVVVMALLSSGFINYTYGLFGMAGGLLGGFLGSHIAIKKGDNFAKYTLLVFMIVSGAWLVVTA